MYLTIRDFIEDWKEESEATLKIFSEIPDSGKSAKENENIRSLERLAWHITQSVTEMPKSCGITEKDIPESFSEIIRLYKEHSQNFVKVVQNKWTDEDLIKELEIYGQVWSGRKVLSALVKHQIHHRAQMTILMRLQNLKVPGVYGPSKEEWSQYGMEAQD
jgi:uncharacterized damage-inducible protein DinB